jgi:pimeloyl-ACP methyl ester carboxylesterase
MPRLPTFRLPLICRCAATLILPACSAGGPGASADDMMGAPAPMLPDVEAPASASPTPTLPQAALGASLPPSRPPEDNPATGGLAPATAQGGSTGFDSEPLPAPPEPAPSNPPETALSGECCDDGDCLCHGAAPTRLTDRNGEFQTESLRVSTGTLFYPTDAEPPFAGLAIAAGFLNTGAEILDWGEFYASHGIVTLVTATLGTDFPDLRAAKLAASIDELQRLNEGNSPIAGQMSGRYGTSGYSMGGGGTTLATASDSTLLSSVGLAPWAPVGRGISTPTLLLCGSTDGTAPCSMSDGAYAQIPESTPKMMVVLPGVGHLAWLRGPTAAGAGGAFALAFTKLYLEGDERWRTVLLDASGDVTTNIAE